MKEYRITYSVGTTRHDERRFVKTVKVTSLRGVTPYALALETRPNTTVTGIELISEVYA